jgi:hypothetical protein
MKATEKAAEELENLPERFRVLREQIAEGLKDVAEQRVSEWDFKKFLRRARALAAK